MKKIFPALLLFIAINLTAQTAPVNTSFIVFSDPHFYDPSLGTGGKAFEDYLDEDRKLLEESPLLLLETLKLIENSDVDFVIIPGDLTKDGTAASHQTFVSRMEQLVSSGRKVYVVPGNHDIANGESNSYQGDSVVRVENISSEDFVAHYMGDEPQGDHKLDLNGVKPLGRIIISFRKKLIKGLYEDLYPQDNDLVISMKTGKVR